MQGYGRRCRGVHRRGHHSSGIQREARVQRSIAIVGPVSVADSAARGSYVSWTDYLRDPRGVGAAGIRVELYPPGTCVVGDIEVRNPAACSVSGSEAENRGREWEL